MSNVHEEDIYDDWIKWRGDAKKFLKEHKYIKLDEVISPKFVKQLLNHKKGITWDKKLSSRRSIKKEWKGIGNLSDKDLDDFSYVELPDGRIDINLPPNLWKQFGIEHVLMNLNSNGLVTYRHKIHHFNLLINPPNKKTQEWHQDNGSLGAEDYYTLLIPLNDVKGMGKTEVYDEVDNETYIPDVPVGGGLLFSGQLTHRGTPNLSKGYRYCLYLIISCLDKEITFENWKA
jgi:hypothetical protein